MSQITTVADALPAEIARVTAKRERWVLLAANHPNLAFGMRLAICVMRHAIDRAVRAAASGDVASMIQALQDLRGYSDDD